MINNNRVAITGTGAIAFAVSRALIPAGFDVTTFGLSKKGLNVFEKLHPNWKASPANVMEVLKGKTRINPIINLGNHTKIIPHTKCDLSDTSNWSVDMYRGYDSLIMSAANPFTYQPEESARRNHEIDKNTVFVALKAGVKNVIYTSSVWRTKAALNDSKLEELIKPETMDMVLPDIPYSRFKELSVRHLRNLSDQFKETTFSHIDMGWYPRETSGLPMSNYDHIGLQQWIAECELQQHYLALLEIRDNPGLRDDISNGQNYFCFNGFSQNDPPAGSTDAKFAYDLSNSKKLGVQHDFNVYSVLNDQDSSWRRIPVAGQDTP